MKIYTDMNKKEIERFWDLATAAASFNNWDDLKENISIFFFNKIDELGLSYLPSLHEAWVLEPCNKASEKMELTLSNKVISMKDITLIPYEKEEEEEEKIIKTENREIEVSFCTDRTRYRNFSFLKGVNIDFRGEIEYDGDKIYSTAEEMNFKNPFKAMKRNIQESLRFALEKSEALTFIIAGATDKHDAIYKRFLDKSGLSYEIIDNTFIIDRKELSKIF